MAQDHPQEVLAQVFVHTDQKIENLRQQISQLAHERYNHELGVKNLEHHLDTELHHIEIKLKTTENHLQSLVSDLQVQFKELETTMTRTLNEQKQSLIHLQHSYQNRIDDLSRRVKAIESIVI